MSESSTIGAPAPLLELLALGKAVGFTHSNPACKTCSEHVGGLHGCFKIAFLLTALGCHLCQEACHGRIAHMIARPCKAKLYTLLSYVGLAYSTSLSANAAAMLHAALMDVCAAARALHTALLTIE